MEYHIEREGDKLFLYCAPEDAEALQKLAKDVEDSLVRAFLTDSPYVVYPPKEQWVKEHKKHRLKKHRLKKHKKL